MTASSTAQSAPTGIGAIRSIDYVFLLCDDLETMTRFYTDVFAFPPQEVQPGRMVEFRVGSMFLGLRVRGRAYDGPSRPDRSAGVQLSFRVPPADVDIAFDALKAKGIDVIEPPTNQHWPHRTVYFRDPENNVLEIFADIHVREMRPDPSGVHAASEN